MIRTTLAVAAVLAVAIPAQAQLIIRTGNRPVVRPTLVPGGVIAAPSLPVTPGGPPMAPGVIGTRPVPRPYVVGNRYRNLFGYGGYYGYYGYGGYDGYLPPYYDPYLSGLYDTRPLSVTNVNQVPPPVVAPSGVTPAPPPPELRARLTLNVPPGAKVWLAGKEVDTAVSPLVLESPVLASEQSYTFDVKVTWVEGRKTEERGRQVTVEAGDRKSLTYAAAQ
jgi:uncharacterized protein (TIGR03000 family)